MPFDTGTAASRAVIAGDIEMSLSPSALLINQISNADANTVAVYGLTNSDCGVDTVGGARSIALRSMLAGGCPGNMARSTRSSRCLSAPTSRRR